MDRKTRINVHVREERFLAGGWRTWSSQKQQQSPTQKAAPKKVKLRPSQIKPLCCPHGVVLTPEEYEVNRYKFSNSDKETAGEINNRDGNAVDLVLLHSTRCIQCNPVCDHKQPMNETEVTEALASGRRFSLACPACTGSENPEAWERILKDYGLARGRGMAPSKFVISTPDGVTHSLGRNKNFETGDIEKRDIVSREDLPTKSSKKPNLDESDEQLWRTSEELEKPDQEYEE